MRTFINIEPGSINEVFDAFTGTGVHGRLWPNCTYAVALFTADGDSHYVITKNYNRGAHAEENIIEHFKTLLANTNLDPRELKLFLNYSPCADCCRRIIEFLNAAGWNLQVEIVFSSFYYVIRPSCDEREECLGHWVSSEEHELRVRGLRELYHSQRVVLRTIYKQDWWDLATALGIDLVYIGGREREDEFLHEDFQHIVNYGA